MHDRRLQLSREEMRALGYRIVDLLVDHFDNQTSLRVAAKGVRAELESRLREPLPEEPTSADDVLKQLEEDVFSHMLHVDHPRFFAFVPSPGNYVGALADALAAGMNPFVGTWLGASGPAQVELVTIDWLRQICGLPEGSGGIFASGGSMANLIALAAARHATLGDDMAGAVAYFSDQTHFAVERGLRVLGFAPEQLRKLPSDDRFRLVPAELKRAIQEDRAAGRKPFCVIANAGTTNTGAVDPLPALWEICGREGLWLHADGAYGAAGMLSGKGRALLDGLPQVDSLALDPHKWLFQPFEIGCVLVRDARLLRNTFQVRPEYLKDAQPAEDEVNLSDYGVQLTRSFRALKLWMSLKVFGLPAFREAVDWGIRLAELAEERLRQSGKWEIVSPAQLAIVAFRYAGADDGINHRLIDRMYDDGFAFLSSTILRERTALRLCTINPRTTEADILETIDRLERFAP
jgi:glutamate/tyrosine decarboxylase-like PLP-dependent enzyme